MVEDRRHEILREINEFVQEVGQSRLGPLSLSSVFSVLASPPPTDIDLSPLIDYLSRYPHGRTWKETSDTIIAYINSFGLSQICSSVAVRRFLHLCVDPEYRDAHGNDLWWSTPDEDEMRIRREAEILSASTSYLSFHSSSLTLQQFSTAVPLLLPSRITVHCRIPANLPMNLLHPPITPRHLPNRAQPDHLPCPSPLIHLLRSATPTE
ncbi:hypothetical protein SISSUDRAFT_434557 [Sistotremastrum suecicum HHB10207 ss-3]|uniref:Uncharacterized protein n=1 Tax=Sistotremastrum suecicum HHB10207 ss-3 TaxID=1314776 RepID=A0A165YFX7_9AGAM|nr:hypothetical protein SISSUDRAFT_434557 [Sistotremastrum suecicum HHB10207 ss-3]